MEKKKTCDLETLTDIKAILPLTDQFETLHTHCPVNIFVSKCVCTTITTNAL